MTDKIKKLFETRDLGKVECPPTPVSGGFMHKMYKVCAGGKFYAVKYLNPEIMKRTEAMENYKKAEKLEKILEDNNIPIVPALSINNAKMQKLDGEYFYIFNWQEGTITDWNDITAEQCRKAGNIQGRIHAIDYPGFASKKNAEDTEKTGSEIDTTDFKSLIEEAKAQNSEIYPVLEENESLLKYALGQMNSARKSLPDIESIIDEDMDPKNVMWNDGEPVVIDLECLDYGNPVSSVIQLSLQWAGITTCSFDPEKMKAFFEGYLEAYDNGFRNYAEVFGLAYTWVEWLEYNIGRALGKCADEDERRLGISEVKNTVNRIKYIYDIEDSVKKLMVIMPNCNVCFRHCKIEEGKKGFCGARTCRDGRIVAANYGKITSAALDPIEKKPLKMFRPGKKVLSIGSYGCNLRCPFCQNSDISWSDRAFEFGSQAECFSPEEIVERALELKSRGNIGVAFTYNEPMVGYEFVRDTARLSKEAGLENVLVTNGTAEPEILDEIIDFIDAMNIDLKAFSKDFYHDLIGGDFEMTKSFIEKSVGKCHVELTTLIIPGENDSEEEMRALSSWVADLEVRYNKKIPLHITRFFPRFHMTEKEPTPVSKILRLVDVAKEKLEFVFPGNI